MMRRAGAGLTIAILASAAAVTEAQAPVRPVPAILITELPERVAVNRRVDPRAVLDRVLSFDADGDERVNAEELPERMKAALDRADKNADGFLTAEEISSAVTVTGRITEARAVILNGTGTLGDVVDDLKLPAPVRQQAIAIVSKYRVPGRINDPNSVALHAEMRKLLDEEDFGNFVAAVARLRFGSLTVRSIVRPNADPVPKTTP